MVGVGRSECVSRGTSGRGGLCQVREELLMVL